MNPRYDIHDQPLALGKIAAEGPVARDIEMIWASLTATNSALQRIAADGAGKFTLPENWAEADRVACEAAVTAAQGGITTALTAIKTLLKV